MVFLYIFITFVAALAGVAPRELASRHRKFDDDDDPEAGKHQVGEEHHHTSPANKALQALNALSGGILFAAALVHMLPEGAEALEGTDCPQLAYILTLLAFLILLSIDQCSAVRVATCAGPDRTEEEEAPMLRGNAVGRGLTCSLGSYRPHPRVCALWCALCVHSLLEGLALGAGGEVAVLVAITSHKGLASIALGSSIIDTQPSTPREAYYAMLILFALCTPLGIGETRCMS